VAEEQKPAEGGGEAADPVQKKGVDEAPPPAAPNQKLVFMVLALNVVFLVGTAVVVWMGNAKRTQTVTLADIAEDKARNVASEVHGDKAADAKAAESSVTFIKEAFTVNITGPQGNKYAKVDVEIEVEDDFVKNEIEKLRPRIRDFILVVLSSKTPEQIESVDGRDFLREEIRNKVNGYLTRGKIKNVYFTQFIVQ
jgi:flagellar FliL protein